MHDRGTDRLLADIYGTITASAASCMQWSDPAFVARRLASLDEGAYLVAQPTVAVMRAVADGVEAGTLRVTVIAGGLRVYRHRRPEPVVRIGQDDYANDWPDRENGPHALDYLCDDERCERCTRIKADIIADDDARRRADGEF